MISYKYLVGKDTERSKEKASLACSWPQTYALYHCFKSKKNERAVYFQLYIYILNYIT